MTGTEQAKPRDTSPWARALVTASAPIVVWALGAIPLPFASGDAAALQAPGPGSDLSVAMLGISPLVTASVIHELISLVAPSRRRTRVGGPAGFARHAQSTLLLALLIAAFQAYGVVQALEAADLLVTVGLVPRAVTVLTLVAGFGLLVVAAMALGRFGLVNGALAMLCAEIVLDLRSAPAWLSDRQLVDGWMAPVAIVAAVLLVAAATLVALAPSIGRRELPESTRPVGSAYRAPSPGPSRALVEAPALPAGLLPVAGAGALVTLLPLVGLGPDQTGPGLASVLGALLLALLLGLAFARPSALAILWGRALGTPPGPLMDEARTAASWAIARGALFAVTLTVLDRAMPIPGASPAAIALLAAVVADAVSTARLPRDTAWVDVWPEPRPSAVRPALEALARDGIPAFAADARLAALLPLIGPIAPTRILVPRGAEARARDVLASVLPAAPVPLADRHEAVPDAPPAGPAAPAAPAPRRATLLVLAAALVAALGLERLASIPPSHDEAVAPARLAVVAVDDDRERARTFLDAVAADLPAGGRVATELVPAGPGRHVDVPYLQVIAGEGEDLGASLARARDWAHAHPLAAGGLGFGPLEEEDETGRLVQIGHRSYALSGEPILTEADVAEASAQLDAMTGEPRLAIRLTAEAADRFAAATRAHTRRRLAFVVDGVVLAAPVVQGEITGGTLHIVLPGSTVGDRLAEVKRLAGALDPRR